MRTPLSLKAKLSLGAGLSLVLLLGGCPYGPRELERYPDREESPYLLPYPRGVSHLCVQGNNGMASHHGRSEFAYDFYMSRGSPVLAARGGVVVAVKEDSDRIGGTEFNNYVRIRHADRTVASYLHLEPEGALVQVGERVVQGQLIARSGWTGYAAMPHLHFHVTRQGRQIPVTFRDVVHDDGIPRTGWAYRAGAE